MATNNAINLSAAGVVTYDGAGTFSASTLTNHSILLGGASNAIDSLGVATNGQLPIGSTGADPVLATLTQGTGISISNAAGSITISATGGGMAWTDITGTTVALVANNGYTMNNVGLVTGTLPSTAAYGSIIHIVGKGSGGWAIAQQTGQTIHFGTMNTIITTGGLASTEQYDCIDLLCTVANTEFTVIDSIGNITVT